MITNALAQFPQENAESVSDLTEDRAAWSGLTRSIGQAIGRDAPLDQFFQELALRSKEPPVGPNTVTLMTIHSAKGKCPHGQGLRGSRRRPRPRVLEGTVPVPTHVKGRMHTSAFSENSAYREGRKPVPDLRPFHAKDLPR